MAFERGVSSECVNFTNPIRFYKLYHRYLQHNEGGGN